MKKLSTKGFSPVEIILVIVAVGILGFVGWFVWKNQQPTEKGASQNQVAPQTTNNAKYDDADGLITTLEESIELLYPGDEKKLPDNVPDSFITYIHGELEKNKAPDEYGCLTTYSVRRYSAVNISGGTGPVDENGNSEAEGCFGGAAMFWYLKDGEWHEHATQSMNLCSEIQKTTIYKEFIEQCLENPNVSMEPSPNPNGSIEQTR